MHTSLAKAGGHGQNARMQRRAVQFEGDGVQLVGELVLPAKAKPGPGVVLLHGAGDGEARFYSAYAERFAEEGIVSLAFDRRGEGQSSGSRNMNLFTLARDAAAAHACLALQPEVDPGRVGFWGYSNGAWVAALAAAEVAERAFVVLTGAAGVSPADAEIYRRTEYLRSQGIGEETLAAVRRAWEIVFDYLARGEWSESWDSELDTVARRIAADAQLMALPVPPLVRDNPLLDSIPRLDSPLFAAFRERMGGASPDMGFDPIATLAGLACPILVVLAGHDESVPVAASLPRFQSLATTANAPFEIEVFEGAGHTFSIEPAAHGDHPSREPRRRESFVPGYLDRMAAFIAANSNRPLV